jgi:oligopeptide transport system permease protein
MGLSMIISLVSVFLTYITSIPLGVAMAKKPGGIIDKLGNVFIVLNYAIPALVFYLIMNRAMGWISFGGNHAFGFFYDEKSPFLTLIPPIFCIWFLSIPGLSIWVRRFMTDELSSDYVKFARSKGLSERTIMYKHVFRNAVVPLVRNIPATFLGAIIGSYYIEYIWKIPGTGILLITALQGNVPDVQMIQGLTIIYGAISMLSFLLGDIITVFFDPRIKLEG